MDWPFLMLFFFGGLSALLLLGLPVAFAFLCVNVIGVYVFWGGAIGLQQLILSIDSSISTFVLVPVPMFILMGTVIFHSGIAYRMIDVLDEWLGKIAGRLALLSIGAGALFATLTGVAMGSVAMLGSTLVPDMERRGYSKSMSIGPILASGSLAIMIPPSALGVILASMGQFSVGKLLIGILLPGLLLAVVYATYVVIRCHIQPHLAPPYEVEPTAIGPRIMRTLQYVLPLVIIIGVVIGTIFAGVATPTEAAALGALFCFLLVACYGKLTWQVITKSVAAATTISVMVFVILTGSAAFSQILAFTGITVGITELALSWSEHPILILIAMQVILLLLGMLIEQTSIVMITTPIYFPIVSAFGWDPVWFGAIMLLNLEMATISPPFGLSLFVMKGITSKTTTMGDIYRAALPFVALNLVVMGIMIAVPGTVLWLPALMR